MRKFPSRARGVALLISSFAFAIALAIFPLRSRGAKGGGQGKRSGPAASALVAASAPDSAPTPATAAHAGSKSTKALADVSAQTPSAAPGASGAGAPPRTAPPAGTPPTAPVAATPLTAPAALTASPHGGAPAIPDPKPLTSIPTGKGLPVEVRVALFFLDVRAFDDTKGEFDCTTDLRLRWADPRLRYPASEAFKGYKEYRGSTAEAQLESLWSPNVSVVNRIDEPSSTSRRLRIFPNGEVETITRTRARYTTHVNAYKFPFDRQHLVLDMLMREETTDEVVLEYQEDDVEFSRHARGMEVDGWTPGLVKLHQDVVPGWNGDRYARVTASLEIDRDPTTGIAPIFIPLIASLLIPMLAVWMNKPDHENGFTVDAFELANIVIGGLFSVIALSFAIYSSYSVIAGSDNTVTRLFALNYASLALALSIVIFFFRYNVPRRLFGPYVQEELYRFLCWAMPVLTVGTSIAFLLVAAA